MSKELTPLEAFVRIARQLKVCDENGRDLDIIETTLKEHEELKCAVNDLANNHIELVKTKGGFYFKIKNSKGKEKSWTSLIDFWKQWFEIKERKI